MPTKNTRTSLPGRKAAHRGPSGASAIAPPVNPLPRFLPGEVIVTFKAGAIPTSIPTSPLAIAKLLNLRKFFRLLSQLDQEHKMLSIQPLVRDGHWIIDTLLPGLVFLLMNADVPGAKQRFTQLLTAGRLRSFESEDGTMPKLAKRALPGPKRTVELMSRLLLRFETAADLDKIIQELKTISAVVAKAEKVPLRYVPNTPFHEEMQPEPSDPNQKVLKVLSVDYHERWGEEVMRWVNAAPGRGKKGKIAVIDTGIDETHPNLTGRVKRGFSTWHKDYQGHGTHVCGILAASPYVSGSDTLMQGLLPDDWEVTQYKVVSNVLYTHGDGSASFYPVDTVRYVSALDDVVNKGNFDAVNISMGGAEPMADGEAYYVNKMASQCPVVAAAGNGGDNFVMYPAAASGVVAVGAAVYRPDEPEPRVDIWKNSNRGPQMRLVAPGFNIFSTVPTYAPSSSKIDYPYLTGRAWKAGTSMAAPFVTALLAMCEDPQSYDKLAKPNGLQADWGDGLPRWKNRKADGKRKSMAQGR